MRIVGIKVGSRSALTAKRDGTVIWNPPIDVPTHNFPWSNVAPNNRVQTKSDLTIRLRSSTTIDATTLLATVTNTRHRGTVLEGPIYNVTNGFWWYRILWDDDGLPNMPTNQGCWVGADNLETAVENEAPIAAGQTLTATVGVGKAITLSATDAENDPLTYTVTVSPTKGVLTGTPPNLTYTPSEIGVDSFKFVANDGTQDSAPATVTITNATAPQPGTIPTRIPSFGPNGTHWPGQVSGLTTPYMYDETVPNRITVACSWSAIAAAVNALTPAQVAAGVLILVQPGNLVGNGSGNTSTSVLADIGDEAWTKRVTICPLNGWNTVNITSGVKFSRIKNICLAGFPISGGMRFQSCTRFAIARCLVSGYIVAWGKSTERTDYKQWEFIEMVKREVRAPDDADVMQLQVPQSGATDHVRGLVVDGSYFAPNYMTTGSTAHQDTIQHLGDSAANGGLGYRFFNATYQDTVVYASNRCTINGGLDTAVFRNCWLNSRKSNQIGLFPVPTGADMLSNAGVNQGSCKDITFDGGFVMGGLQSNTDLAANPYPFVMNDATIDYTPTGAAAPVEGGGAWIVDPSLDGHTNPGHPQFPTDEYLASIWS